MLEALSMLLLCLMFHRLAHSKLAFGFCLLCLLWFARAAPAREVKLPLSCLFSSPLPQCARILRAPALHDAEEHILLPLFPLHARLGFMPPFSIS